MDVKRLNREQLLELLLSQQQTIEYQEAKIKELQEKLDDKLIKIENSGSIAEASLALNKVFEAAQEACDQYILNIKKIYDKKERDE